MEHANNDPESSTPPHTNRVSLTIDLRLVILLLLIIIGGMFVAWKPWQEPVSNDSRTVSVTGDAKLKAEPDQYVFYPTYQFKDKSKETALANLTKKSDELIKELKKLGVADNQIKSNSDGYDYSYYYDQGAGQSTYSLQLTITVNNKALAQKVQDYLVSTEPSGAVSPSASFSDTKRKELQSKARDQATKDARAKAEQSAKNLGFKVGKVKSVKDGTGFDDQVRLYEGANSAADISSDAKASLTVQPGQDDLTYSVNVVYYVK